MTEKKQVAPPMGFFLSAERRERGMRISIGAIVSIADFSPEEILLVSHGGRIKVSGEGLMLSVFEGRCVEIIGYVKEIDFLYGKN